MGYAAVKGGFEAIRAAERLVERKRTEGRSAPLALDQVLERLRLLVDRVQSEAALWAPTAAARAVRQAEGESNEATLLLRAYRTTLPRLGYSQTVRTEDGELWRRIVPAYKEPAGPQLLGRTTDYTERLIDFSDGSGGEAPDGTPVPTAGDHHDAADGAHRDADTAPASDHEDLLKPPRRLLDLMRERDLLSEREPADDAPPADLTRTPLTVPATRSARLAALTRAETGALVNLWYQAVRGDRQGGAHPTLGEVRVGTLPLRVTHPHTGGTVTIGAVTFTEVEAFASLDRPHEDESRFDVGYGLVLGHNERKAIAMALLDVEIERDGGRTSLEQNVLLTCDGTDASGFLEHLKLPHYVTFASQLDRKEAVRR